MSDQVIIDMCLGLATYTHMYMCLGLIWWARLWLGLVAYTRMHMYIPMIKWNRITRLLGLAIHRCIPGHQVYLCMYRCLLILGDWVRIYSSMCHGAYTYVNI
jgi:hypothetical protein